MSTPGPQPYPPAPQVPPGAAQAPWAAVPAHEQWRPRPQRRTSVLVVEIVAIALGLAGAVWVLSLVLAAGGPLATALGGVLAFVPLLGVLLAVRWVDRWEPEPRWLLLAALLWGAGVSTAVSLVLNEGFAAGVLASTGSAVHAQVLGAVLGAPVVEEIAKGLGVLLVFLLRRRSFDGPVDGIVYGAVVAAGFAFTENILYFVQFQDVLSEVFVGRAIQGPFAHVTFTAVTGIALGLASRARNQHAWLWMWPVGVVGAIMLHAVWNGSAVLTIMPVLYVVFQVPLFAAGIVLVLWLRNDEKATIGNRLTEYATAGWFVPHEITMLTSMQGRRRAQAWAAARGAGEAMVDFQRAATSLAYARQRAISGRPQASREEARLLDEAVRARAAFLAPAARR